MTLPHAIVLGVDTPIGLTVVRELGSHGVPIHGIGRNANAIGRTSRFLQSFSVRPAGDPLAEWLPGRIRASGAKALFAISESDLVELAAMPEEIEGCRILTPRKAQLDLVLDKNRTLEIAEANGLDVPKSWQPQANEKFAHHAEALSYPVVVKWADPPAMTHILSHFGLELVKAEHAASATELLAILERYTPLREWPLVQSYCPGFGLGQMLHMEDGKATLEFQHRRLHEWPPEGGVSTLCAAMPQSEHAAQMKKSKALLAAMGWSGPAMVEYRHDPRTGKYWLMEVNGRFWGSLPLARHCGAEFAWEQYCRAVPGVPKQKPQALRVRRARFMIPETRRLAKILFGTAPIANFRRRRIATLATYVAGFFDPRMRYYVFSLSDPMPFFQDMAGAFRRIVRGGRPPQDD